MSALRTLLLTTVLAIAAAQPAHAARPATTPPAPSPTRTATPAVPAGNPADADRCGQGPAVITDVDAAADWAPVTPSKWRFPGDAVVLAEAGVARPGPRRPFEYAVLTTGPTFGSVRIDAELRLDTPTSISNRDVIIVFGHRSDTEFYYVHLSQDNTIYPHNGIFVVDNADRLRIDDQWNGHVGAPPAVTDTAWHHVQVRHCTETGRISVHVDGAAEPLMTATDRTFASGRVGFGSFDNIGSMRDLTVAGVPTCEDRPATIVGTAGRDHLRGTGGPDVIAALSGDDHVSALGGDDVVCAGDGSDLVLAGDGDDHVYGEAGRDVLLGQRGDDVLSGGPDRDLVVGGPGSDDEHDRP